MLFFPLWPSIQNELENAGEVNKKLRDKDIWKEGIYRLNGV